MHGISVKINEDGNLFLLRKSEFKPQFCPYVPYAQDKSRCGDWCPRFGEPEWSKAGTSFYFGLKCCQTLLLVVDLPLQKIGSTTFGSFELPKEFIDERVYDNKKG